MLFPHFRLVLCMIKTQRIAMISCILQLVLGWTFWKLTSMDMAWYIYKKALCMLCVTPSIRTNNCAHTMAHQNLPMVICRNIGHLGLFSDWSLECGLLWSISGHAEPVWWSKIILLWKSHVWNFRPTARNERGIVTFMDDRFNSAWILFCLISPKT